MAFTPGTQRRLSRECTVCHFLADLPDGYRGEVLDVLSGWGCSTYCILHQLGEDGHPTVINRFSWEKHRRGDCNATVRRRLLGERDGVRGPSRR